MRALTVLPVALLTLLANPAQVQASAAAPGADESARVESAVTDFLAAYLGILEGGDPEAIRGLYVGDGRFAWFTDGEKRYTSGDQVIESLASMGEMTFSTESSDLEVVALAPNLAHARSAFHTKVSQDGAVVYEFGGVITWLDTSTPKSR